MTKKHWNELVSNQIGISGDDPLPHTVCKWTVCPKPEGHNGDCEHVPLDLPGAACGQIAWAMGFGPCPDCPQLAD